MSKNEDISGFITGEPQAESPKFTHIEKGYASADGYTCLYRCERLGKRHMLKALQPAFIGQDFYEQALRKEFNIGFQLDHLHICRTLSWERIEGLGNCIVLEYIDGVSLAQFIEERCLTNALARKFVTEICAALSYLHKKQIVHRDLKPSNILITHNGDNVKLIDFSLADADDATMLKLPAGTRHYLAPEVLEDAPLDCRADIYSLGVIIGEMATLLNDSRLAAVSRQCTERRPAQRPANAEEVAASLHRQSFPWKAVLIAAVLLLLVGIGLFMGRQALVSEPSPLPYHPDSLYFGNIEVLG